MGFQRSLGAEDAVFQDTDISDIATILLFSFSLSPFTTPLYSYSHPWLHHLMITAQQGICSAATFFCYIRFAPLWIAALLGLALVSARAWLVASRPASVARKANGPS
jgi:hypothetical protein